MATLRKVACSQTDRNSCTVVLPLRKTLCCLQVDEIPPLEYATSQHQGSLFS